MAVKYDLYVLHAGGQIQWDSIMCHACGNKNNVEFAELNYGKGKWVKLDPFKPENKDLRCHICGYPSEIREAAEQALEE